MNTRSELPQPQADRTIEAKIERVRTRVKQQVMDVQLRGVLMAMLDLLADEL